MSRATRWRISFSNQPAKGLLCILILWDLHMYMIDNLMTFVSHYLYATCVLNFM